MNANELADLLEGLYDGIASEYSGFEQMEEAADMLRQQQEKLNKYELRNEEQRNRITHLEADNKRLKGFCWETDEAKEFLAAVRKAQEK